MSTACSLPHSDMNQSVRRALEVLHAFQTSLSIGLVVAALFVPATVVATMPAAQPAWAAAAVTQPATAQPSATKTKTPTPPRQTPKPTPTGTSPTRRCPLRRRGRCPLRRRGRRPLRRRGRRPLRRRGRRPLGRRRRLPQRRLPPPSRPPSPRRPLPLHALPLPLHGEPGGSYAGARSVGFSLFDVAGSTSNPAGVKAKLDALPSGTKAMIWVGNLGKTAGAEGFTRPSSRPRSTRSPPTRVSSATSSPTSRTRS